MAMRLKIYILYILLTGALITVDRASRYIGYIFARVVFVENTVENSYARNTSRDFDI